MQLESEEQQNLLIQLLETIVPGGRNLKEVELTTTKVRELITSIQKAEIKKSNIK